MGGESLEVMIYDYYGYQRNDGSSMLRHHQQQLQQLQLQQQDVGFAVQLCAFVDACQLVDEDERG